MQWPSTFIYLLRHLIYESQPLCWFLSFWGYNYFRLTKPTPHRLYGYIIYGGASCTHYQAYSTITRLYLQFSWHIEPVGECWNSVSICGTLMPEAQITCSHVISLSEGVFTLALPLLYLTILLHQYIRYLQSIRCTAAFLHLIKIPISNTSKS